MTESRPDNERMPVTTHRSASTDLARGLAVAALAVMQIVVAGLGGSGATGEDVGTRRSLVPHARPACGVDVRHLGADLPGLPRLRGLPAASGTADSRGAPGHGLVACGLGRAQHGVDHRLLDPVRAGGGAADPGAARGAGAGVRPAEPGTLRRHGRAPRAAPARGALHRMGVAGRGGRDGRDRRPVGPAGRRGARRDRRRADPGRGRRHRRERRHLCRPPSSGTPPPSCGRWPASR